VALDAGDKKALRSTLPRVTQRLTHTSERERATCPLYTAIAVIDGRWKPMLFQRLSDQPRGFGELHRMLPGVTKKVLREQLRQMQADDLVHRRQLSPTSAGVRYSLTSYGRRLGPVFETLWRWGSSHLARRGATRGTRVPPPHVRIEES
jgi:DNA-binding HxlR family transcriptional regulator